MAYRTLRGIVVVFTSMHNLMLGWYFSEMKNLEKLCFYSLLFTLLPATAHASEFDHVISPFVSLAKGIGWFIAGCLFIMLIIKGIKDDRKRGR